MKAWLARDKNGSLWIYEKKPIKDGDVFGYNVLSGKSYQVDDDWLKNVVTWENSPKKIKIKL